MAFLMIMVPSKPRLLNAKVKESLLALETCCVIRVLHGHVCSLPGSAQYGTRGSSVIFKPYLQIGSIVFGYIWAVALTQHCDLLLNVLYLIFSFFQINDLYGNHFLSPIVNAFEHLTERALSNFLQLGKKLLWIRFEVLRKRRKEMSEFPESQWVPTMVCVFPGPQLNPHSTLNGVNRAWEGQGGPGCCNYALEGQDLGLGRVYLCGLNKHSKCGTRTMQTLNKEDKA